MISLSDAIKALHARKDKSYGAAWKQRGERISVLPNIARKIDRLVVFANTQIHSQDESILDTAVDLLVYCGKYLLFLAEVAPELLADIRIPNPVSPLTDHVENFSQLLDQVDLEKPDTSSLPALISSMEQIFERLWPMADTGSTPQERFTLAFALWRESAMLVAFVAVEQPDAIGEFVNSEILISTEL